MTAIPGQDAEGDELLIELLARGCSHSGAAKATGISDRTVRRRLQDTEFRERVKEARRELSARTTGKLAEASVSAVSILAKLAKSAKSEAIRVKAATALLELNRRYDERFDLTEEVRGLLEWRKATEGK